MYCTKEFCPTIERTKYCLKITSVTHGIAPYLVVSVAIYINKRKKKEQGIHFFDKLLNRESLRF